MEIQKIITITIVGFIAGFIGSSTGSAGGILMVSGLLLAGIFTKTKMAIGTVLLALLFPLSIGAIYAFWKKNLIDLKVSGILIVSNIIGAGIGGHLVASHISDKSIDLFNATYLVLLSLLYFYKYYYNI